MAPLAPALVLIFGMPACGRAALGAGCSDRLGAGCHVVGCASAGEIGPQGYAQDSVVALGFPGASFRAGFALLPIRRRCRSRPGWRACAAIRRVPPDLRRASFGVLLADALARHEDVLAATLDAAIPGLPVVGPRPRWGSISAGRHHRRTGRASRRGGVLLMETDLAVAEISFSHFSPTDRARW